MPTLLEDLDAARLALQLALVPEEGVLAALAARSGDGATGGLVEALAAAGALDPTDLRRLEAALRYRDESTDESPTTVTVADAHLPPSLDPPGKIQPPSLPGGASVVRVLARTQGIRGGAPLASRAAPDEGAGRDSPFDHLSAVPDFRYRFGREIGKGGSGLVTVAWDEDIGRRVALKVLKSGRAAGRHEVERLVHEVQITGQLEHPNIVPVHDIGLLPDGVVYFTMKLVEGRTLEVVIRGLRKGIPTFRRQFGRNRLVHVVQQVCQAIGFAHSRGVVHRDLKPANIMLGEYGEVVVMDWGLAKVRAHADEEAPPRSVRTLRSADGADATLDGTIKGTPAYMAPEQARGQAGTIDERTDVYALGALLYECLTYRRPHEGTEPLAVIRAVVRDDVVPPRERAPGAGIPEELEAVVMRCIEKDPARRFPTAMAVHQELETWQEGTRRRQRAAAKVKEADALLETYRGHQRELSAAQRTFRERSREVTAWDPLDAKRAVWEMQRDLLRRQVEETDTLGEVVNRYGQALGDDPENPEARRALAALYWERFRDAEERRDTRDSRYYRKRVEQFDDGAFRAALVGDGGLEVRSDPPGAEAVIARFEEADLVMTPTAARSLGRTPTGRSPLPMGSHLLTLTLPGYLPTRCPVRVDRCEEVAVEVALVPVVKVPAGFAYVPGGAFLAGGDPQAFDPAERGRVEVAPFAIAETPVTMGQYLEFINALAAEDPLVAQFRAPRSRGGTDAYFMRAAGGRWFIPATDRRGDPIDPAFPAFGVSHADAESFAAWRSRVESRMYRLPSGAEWEKAARGTDGRIYPWGDLFDPGFCKTEESRQARPRPEPVGAFPKDCSPYGVRDCAGGIREWCSDWFDAPRRLRMVRGGAWDLPRAFSRVCNRAGEAEEHVADDLGFRLLLEVASGAEAPQPGTITSRRKERR